MKAGITTSAFAHAAIVGFAMVSLSSPRALEVPDVEALPVDIVPIESLTKTIEGDKKADRAPTPSPKPTTTPPKPRPEPADNVGEAKVDKKAEAPKADETPPSEKTAAPKARPVTEQKPEPETVSTPELAADPVPKTDIAALVEDNQPEETPVPKETPEASDKPLQSIPIPKVRPSRPKPETAATNKRTSDDKPKAQAQQTETQKKDDKVAALLNRAEANAGGAKKSDKQAALGAKKSNNAVKLSQSEVDALRGQIQACWNVAGLAGVEGAEKLRAKVIFKLDQTGNIDGRPKATASGGDNRTNRTFAGSARRAVMGCQPYELPRDKYETWADVEVNFSLKDML